MNQPSERHVPEPEFVEALESEVVAAFRRQPTSLVPPSVRRVRGLRTGLTLALGLAVGAGTVVASAQVQTNRERALIIQAAELQKSLAALRLDALEGEYQLTRLAVNAGTRTPDDLEAMQIKVRIARLGVERKALDIQETQKSGMNPRNELWAPLVDNRDFVVARLKTDAAEASARLEGLEKRLEMSGYHKSTSSPTSPETETLLSEVALVQGLLNASALKLAMRNEFLNKRITQEALALRLEQMEANLEMGQLQRLIYLAESRLGRLRKDRASGNTSELEVKRAEVEVLQRTLELRQVEQQHQLLLSRLKKD